MKFYYTLLLFSFLSLPSISHAQYGQLRPGDKMQFQEAEFETKTLSIETKSAYSTYQVISPNYTYVLDSVEIIEQPTTFRTVIVPAVFDTITETITIKDRHIIATNACETCTEEAAPQTRTFIKIVLVAPATTIKVEVPAVTRWITYHKRVQTTPEAINLVKIPSQQQQVTVYDKTAEARFIQVPKERNDCTN